MIKKIKNWGVFKSFWKSTGFRAGGKKAGSKTRILLIAIGVIALFVFSFSLYQILQILQQSNSEKLERQEIFGTLEMDEQSQYFVVPYAELQQTNPDFVSWLDIPNTAICYPVVYSSINNEVYLRTSFNNTYAVSGSIFVDYRCKNYFTDRMTIIYGHRMNDNTMFAQLKGYLDQSFYENHKEIHIYTEKGIGIYYVFSAYTADVYDPCFTLEFESDAAFTAWGRTMKNNSVIKTSNSVNADSTVILLSTCVWNQPENRNVVLAVYDRTEPNP